MKNLIITMGVSAVASFSSSMGNSALAASDAVQCVPNVQRAFAQIPAKADKKKYLAAWDDGKIQWPRYTDNTRNSYKGVFGGQNHFQGIVRYKQYAIVSGGDPHTKGPRTKGAHLFVFHMKSRPVNNAWAQRTGNLAERRLGGKKLKNVPAAVDRMVAKVNLSARLWHAGGMQVMGDYLAVPIESGDLKRSEILFFDLSNPASPRRLPVTIKRNRKAGAVAMTKLKNGHILVGVWADSDPGMKQNLDFYYSKTTDLARGFYPRTRWNAENVLASKALKQKRTFDKFQAVNFIKQCDGGLFLMGMHNTSKASPVIPGRDYADLYRVVFTPVKMLLKKPQSINNPPSYRVIPRIIKIANKHMYCKNKQCNFGAGGSVYIAPGGKMWIYGVYHWRKDRNRSRDNRVFPFNEYSY